MGVVAALNCSSEHVLPDEIGLPCMSIAAMLLHSEGLRPMEANMGLINMLLIMEVRTAEDKSLSLLCIIIR